jgi:hypothetical protein
METVSEESQSNANGARAALIRALEDAGIEFIERTKTKGPGVRLKE